MLKFVSGLAALALLVAGCGVSDVELDGDLEINGMDPVFWGVKVDRTAQTTTIAVTGERDIQGELPAKSKDAKDATLLTTKTPAGDFVMRLQRETCKDGLGERAYEWSVSVSWQGETLKGCAHPA
jgi:uncharacterized membrane protein